MWSARELARRCGRRSRDDDDQIGSVGRDRLDVRGEAPRASCRGAFGIGRVLVDRHHLLAGADREQILGRRVRQRHDPSATWRQRHAVRRPGSLTCVPTGGEPGRVIGADRQQERRSARRRAPNCGEPGRILMHVIPPRVVRREVARRHHRRTIRPSSEGLSSSVSCRRPGSSPGGGASQLRDSAGFTPASLDNTGRGYEPGGGQSTPSASPWHYSNTAPNSSSSSGLLNMRSSLAVYPPC